MIKSKTKKQSLMAVYEINFAEVMAIYDIPYCLFLRQPVKGTTIMRITLTCIQLVWHNKNTDPIWG